jgi:hypothetical protein
MNSLLLSVEADTAALQKTRNDSIESAGLGTATCIDSNTTTEDRAP